MSPACETIDLRELESRPWKNGAGVTRELAVAPAGASLGDFDWRISVAEVARDAPFSTFDGVDRCIVLLRGAGMRLHGVDERIDERLDGRRHRPLWFRGEVPLHASLIDGACSDLNLMLRRARFRADVTAHADTAQGGPADAGLLLCSEGGWLVQASGSARPVALAAMQALLWRAHMPPLTAQAAAAHSVLLFVQIHARGQEGVA